MWISTSCVFLLLTVLLLAAYYPVSRADMTGSVAMVECRSFYTVKIGGRTAFFFGGIGPDTTLVGLGTDSLQAVRTTLSAACWTRRYALLPSCRGRLLVSEDTTGGAQVCRQTERQFATIVRKERKRLSAIVAAYTHEASELKYYLSVHGVQDEGFNDISGYADRLSHSCDSVRRLLAMLEKIDTGAGASVTHTVRFTLLTHDADGKSVRQPCLRLTDHSPQGFSLIQTADGQTPSEARPVYFHTLGQWPVSDGDMVFIASFAGMGSKAFTPGKGSAALLPARLRVLSADSVAHDLSRRLAPDGSPVFSRSGHLIGISRNGCVVREGTLHSLFKQAR